MDHCLWYKEAVSYHEDLTGSLPGHLSRRAAVEEEMKRAATRASDENSFIVERERSERERVEMEGGGADALKSWWR